MASNHVKPDADIIRDYDRDIQPELLKALQPVQWASFALVKEGGNYVLNVDTQDKDHSNSSWIKAISSLKTAFMKLTKRELHVNVSQTKVYEEVRHVVPGKAQPYDPRSKNPFGIYSLGRSIGVEELGFPGTLGGFISVPIKGSTDVRVYGLTNNHVVNIGKTTGTQAETEPLFVHRENVINSPNIQDLRATEIQSNKKLTKFKLGQLSAASGRRLAPPLNAHNNPSILDWALIQLNSATLADMQKDDRKLKPNFQLPRSETENKANPFPASIRYNPAHFLHVGMEVYKWGRTTGVLKGTVNDFKSTVDMAQVELWKGKFQRLGNFEEVEEFTVRAKDKRPFCEPGDSGSFVVDEDGCLVGLLWGLIGDDTIVTDIRQVFISIRENLGLAPGAPISVAQTFPKSSR